MNILNITDEIAGLTITNVVIKDIDEIPDQVIDGLRGGNSMLFPWPENTVTNVTTVRQTFGLESSAKRDYTYSLTYMFAYCLTGEGRGLKDIVGSMASRAMTVIEAIAEHEFASDGGIEVIPTIQQFSVYSDPANTEFHGCLMTIDVLEYGEV